ncbi:MAG TPA: DUF6734 family protein [Pyrinomonadaceae bacterium]|nr:DUF6734 family protein [Pyrinomonadaceae bacterium]
MRAVWSLWTKPYSAGLGSGWYSEWHHWLAWGLSVYTARQHYPQTCLVTDDDGARLLVDELQLPFDEVSTGLNALRDHNPEWWSLGKVEAYRRQREPFVHVDADVFLWKSLPSHLTTADVFAQHPEPDTPGVVSYHPADLESAIGRPNGGWLPKEWIWYRRNAQVEQGQCCGVLGGNRVDFINHYAESALQLVAAARNRKALQALAGKGAHMLLVEQYLLTACVEYHHQSKSSPYRGIEIRHVFPTISDAFNPDRATEAGFTHLVGAKRNALVSRDLELRVQCDLPNYYDRCRNYAAAPGK